MNDCEFTIGIYIIYDMTNESNPRLGLLFIQKDTKYK